MTNHGFVTLFYKSLTVIDAAVVDSLQGLMGQSWYVDIALTGQRDDEGVIADFSKIKNKIKKIIDETIDHKLIINEKQVNTINDQVSLEIPFGSNEVQKILYRAPLESVCLIPQGSDEKSLEAFISSILMQHMPSNVQQVEVSLRQESHPEMFHYTHGLKQHYGNCQRLFHGHKNTIEVWKNGVRETQWEKKLVQQIFKGNIHFAFWENVVNKKAIQAVEKNPIGILNSKIAIELEYTSSQGNYWATLPANQVFIMPCETTIENIAAFFAQWIKDQWGEPTDKIMVVGFEGIAKGAKAITH
jgi:6-pyruvoyl-tetrahydropterin synthase